MAADAGASLRRGIAVLFALETGAAEGRSGLGVTQIAQRIGWDKSQVSRTLKILAEHELVERDADTRAYRLSSRLFVLAGRAGDQQLLEQARPYLRSTVAELGERAHLSVLQGHEVLTLLSESPAHAVQAAGWVGRAVPVHCTASGRALLFDHDRAAIEAFVLGTDIASGGPNAPRDVDELVARVEHARAVGYASVTDELEAGLVAVAAPVRDYRGAIVAALNVSAPKFRFARRLRAAGELIAGAAGELSSRLGFRAPSEADGRR
ncbi:MAG: IclR family transcriptional regulator [Actinobacteria bacterium]|nr:IclR family transcriptional regulator [Actinomycetota bacterium]